MDQMSTQQMIEAFAKATQNHGSSPKVRAWLAWFADSNTYDTTLADVNFVFELAGSALTTHQAACRIRGHTRAVADAMATRLGTVV